MGRQHDFGMDNAAFAGVIMRHAVPLVDQLCPTAICSSGNDRFSLAALYQLDGAMKNRRLGAAVQVGDFRICSTVTVYCSYSVFGNLYEIFKIARYAIRKIKERT